MEFEEYEELGLTKNESKAYTALIEFGKLGAGEVSQKSGVSYSRIYDILDSLINKGLVEIVPEKTKKFIASDPSKFLELIEKKEKILEKAKMKINEMKIAYETKEKNPVVLNFGKKGFYKVVKELKRADKYSYAIKWTSEYRDDWARDTIQAFKRKVDSKVLTRYDDETKENIKKWVKIKNNVRKFDNQGIAMAIIDDEEVMIGLIKNNVTILVKDEAFSDVMKRLFLAAYEKAEKVK